MTELEKALTIFSRQKLPPKHTWTSALPTESGYYWMRSVGEDPYVVEVWIDAATLQLTYQEIGHEEEFSIGGAESSIFQWWPIPIPAPED